MLEMIQMTIYRIVHNRLYFLMALLVTPIVVFGAIFFTNNIESKFDIAIVGEPKHPLEAQNVNFHVIEQMPSLSELVRGKYDATIVFSDGKAEVITVKNEAFKEIVEQIVEGDTHKIEQESKRGVGANFIGFITMFILLFASMLFKFYYDEKKGIDKRILSTSMDYVEYSISHCIVVFLILFVPTLIITIGAKLFGAFNTVITALDLSFLIFVLCLFGTALSFFIASVIKSEENGGVVSTMIVVMTTLISGSLFEVSKDSFLYSLSHIFPQRYFLEVAIAIENGISPNYLSLFVIIGVSAFLVLFGILANKKRLRSAK